MGGKFVPGKSGNPAGRPKGSRNRLSVLRDSLVTATEAREVVAKLVESAKAGDTQAASILMDRLWPKLKSQAPALAVPLPDGDLADQAETVVREMAAGMIPVADAGQMLAALASVARIKETVDFEKRLDALERRAMFLRSD
ncbi:hypothetical protein GCM10011521_04160 [Arenimonas soli]|uniref:DUF5681 domain-containing protein n=1 Tax=Arenimonas soli TaxID=2269504 RepID=A0ABQ1HCD4_9GAMM|nr:DUF5681 domain-containing protein [Arenimonas soli]GGA69114.1 hypothetical protein GCM10011521_04160 [Arenimonas soli]